MVSQIEGYRLSPQQLHLWLLQQTSPAYSSQCALLLEGDLDTEALTEALRAVVRRHDILRTSFRHTPGIKLPVQVIAGEAAALAASGGVALATEKPLESETEIDRILNEQEAAALDPENNGAPLRAALYPVATNRHLLVVQLPALYADTQSLVNLAREIGDAYAASSKGGEPSSGEPEAVQYLQFSEWQNEIINDEDSEVGKAFWRKQEDSLGFPPLALPFQKTPDRNIAFNPRSVSLAFDSDATARIEATAATLQTNIAVLLQACWQTLLWRLTGQADAVVGYVNDGRKYDELRGSLGLFARTLPLHQRFEAGASFGETLRQIEQKKADADEWMEYFTFDSAAANDAKQPDFFPVSFEFVELPDADARAALAISLYRHHSYFDRFTVKLTCTLRQGVLVADFQYDSALLGEEDVRRLAEQFQTLLLSLAQNPDASIDALEVTSERERQRLTVEFNATAVDYAGDRCIHRLLEEQAARTPDEVAVVYGEEHLSYRDLHARSNQLANYLQALGVGAESLVGIYMERSTEMVVSLLGVLKAGGAYVPLDLSYPKERLAFMLEDAQVSVILTQDRTMEQLPETDATVISLDGYWPMIETESEDAPAADVSPDNAAYVIYTSGSTGKPKGVVIPHRSLFNYLRWATDNYKVADGRGATVHSPLGFDLTITSLFTPLLTGKSVVLIPEADGLEGFNTILRNEKNLSLIKLTPPHLELLNQMLAPEDVGGAAGSLVVGGEALWNETVAFWRTHAPQTRIINEYGPTETVVGCCIYEVNGDTAQSAAVPIGRPIANTQIYLLDTQFRPVPAGVVGELYIGGAQLARGYLRRPDLTAEKFVPDPFSKETGARLYRTGDSARFLADTQLEYVGRIDHQVKVRGYRIELGEIEAVLSQHEAVREVVLMAREDVIGDKRLVAYIVPQGNQELPAPELRRYLQDKLPDYMMPSAFVSLDALPLTPNGKVDRNVLPMPGLGLGSREETYVAPRTPLEEILAAVWSETIGVERVGVEDNFFELGGHSLLATQVLARVQEDFQVELPLRIMFEGMTVEQMAQAVIANEAVAGQSEKIARALLKIESMSETEFVEALQQKRDTDESEGRSQKA